VGTVTGSRNLLQSETARVSVDCGLSLGPRFVGCQAQGTRGRALLDGAPEVNMHGRSMPVAARVACAGARVLSV